MYERPDNQPPDDKEIRYTDCEECGGEGFEFGDIDYEDDSGEIQVYQCCVCHGEGQIEIED